MHVFPNPVTYRIFFIVLRIKHGMYIMKQKDLEEIVDEQLDEQGVDEEQCDNVSSEKGKRKRKQLKVYYVYILSSFK